MPPSLSYHFFFFSNITALLMCGGHFLSVIYSFTNKCASLITSLHAQSLESCLSICNPVDCSLPDSSVHGIFQAKTLEWVAISFSRGSSQARVRTFVSYFGKRTFNHWVTQEVQLQARGWFISFYNWDHTIYIMRVPGGSVVKESTCQCKRPRRHRLDPWVRKIP